MNQFRPWVAGTLLALVACSVSAGAAVRVGELTEITGDQLWLKEASIGKIGSHALIAFTADAWAVDQLAKVSVGQEVRIVLGDAMDPVGGHRTSSLVSIRACAPREQECILIRKRNQIQLAKQLQQSAVRARRDAACEQAMDHSLAREFRGLEARKTDPAQASLIVAAAQALTGKQRACYDDFTDRFQRAYFAACEKHHCGDGIGGGCYHLTGEGVQAPVIAKAVEKCSSSAEQPNKP